MSTAACLDDNRAAEFATGALAAMEASRVEQHLAGCRDCRSLVAALSVAGEDSDLVTSPRAAAGFIATAPAIPGNVSTFSVGDRIGRYVVLGRLGQGGMGVVLSAYDPQLDRKVAIKLLRTGVQVTTTEARARMVREAKAIAQLSHPNVVAVYDVGTAKPGDVYIAMEFVEGDTATVWQRKWDRTWRDVLDVFLQAGRGLAAAHGAGLLHRDFKPDNVLVGADGRVRVGDFGLARSVVGGPDDGSTPPPVISAALAGSLTATGTIVGTPRYMAPETLRGKDSDARSDQFSFCVALYEALYGRHPFDGETALALIEGGKAAAPPPVDTKVPAAIGRAVLRGLEDVPTRRFPSMATLIAALTPPPVRAPRRIVAAVAVALLAAGAAGAAVISRGAEETHIPTAERQRYDETIAELKAALDERNKLIVDLTEEVAKGETTIVELQAQVAVQDEKIERLIAAVDVDMHRPDPPRTKDGRAVITRLRAGRRELVNCFGEWAERNPGKDTKIRIRASVSPTGVTYGWAAVSDDHPSLATCIMDALKDRVPLPAPGLKLQVGITAMYTGGEITVDPEVLTAEEASGGTIDLGSDPRAGGKIDL